MKKQLLIVLALLLSASAFSQNQEIIKRGWNFGPVADFKTGSMGTESSCFHPGGRSRFSGHEFSGLWPESGWMMLRILLVPLFS